VVLASLDLEQQSVLQQEHLEAPKFAAATQGHQTHATGTCRDISRISNNIVPENEKDIRTVVSVGRGMVGSEWKNGFIKQNIPRNVNAAFGHIEALETLMHIAIA
jgi:hypothetical protein